MRTFIVFFTTLCYISYAMTKQTFSETFPNIIQWIDQGDTVEIGEEQYTDSLVRALDEGGVVWESLDNLSLDDALQRLDSFLEKYFEENR